MEKINYRKEFIKYAALNMLGMLGLSCYILADTFFISKGLGANGLTALNLAIPVYSFIHGSGLMFAMGGATKFTIFKSQKKQDEMNRVFTNTICLTLCLAVCFILSGLFLSGTITRLLGADTAVEEMTNIYLKILLLFSPAFMMNDVLICFVRNDGNPKLPMLAMLSGSLVNIILDYIFIFPLHMGIFGAVLATGFAPLTSISVLSPHWIRRKNQFHFVKAAPCLRTIQSILALGVPSLITELSSGIVMIVFNMIILSLRGNTGVAAYGIIANLSLVIVSIYTGIAQGAQPLISRAYGYSDRKNTHRVLHDALITMGILSCAVYLLIFLFPDSIASVFNSEHNAGLQAMAVEGLRLYFTSVLFAGFNIIMSVYFTSIEKAIPAQVISLLRGFFVIVPMAFLLSMLFEMTGVWLALPATELLVSLAGGSIYLVDRRRIPKS